MYLWHDHQIVRVKSVCVTNIIVVTAVRMIVHGKLMVVVIKCHPGEEMNKLPSNRRPTTKRANHKRKKCIDPHQAPEIAKWWRSHDSDLVSLLISLDEGWVFNHCSFLLSIMPKFPEATVEPSIERRSPGKRHFRMAGLSRSTKYKFQEFSFSASFHQEIIIPVSLVSLSGCHDGKHTIAKAHYGSKPK